MRQASIPFAPSGVIFALCANLIEPQARRYICKRRARRQSALSGRTAGGKVDFKMCYCSGVSGHSHLHLRAQCKTCGLAHRQDCQEVSCPRCERRCPPGFPRRIRRRPDWASDGRCGRIDCKDGPLYVQSRDIVVLLAVNTGAETPNCCCNRPVICALQGVELIPAIPAANDGRMVRWFCRIESHKVVDG